MSVNSPTRILFADLSHLETGSEWSVLPMPINMGYLASFVQAYASHPVDVRICKVPRDFVRLMTSFEPHVVALSNYIWNSNLAAAAASWVRREFPEALIVMGGPNINTTELDVATTFLRERREVDFYIPNEGEVPFLRLIEAFLQEGQTRAGLRGVGVYGTWSLDGDSIQPSTVEVPIAAIPGGLDARTGRLLDLNDIPSPYLTGVMDEFLANPAFVPLIETNRGCPYSCTFCSWGDMAKSKSSSFPLDRILGELDLLAEANVSRVSYLYIGDANFGLFNRDIEIARHLRKLRETKGFPDRLYLYFAKNSSKRVVEIAEILQGMTTISLSRQTQNDDVLRNIKRKNIDIETFNSLSRHAKALGVDSFAELIYGLPGESLESFLTGVADVLDSDVDGLHFFPAMLLNGSEMATQVSREVYGLKGEYRAIDRASGNYGHFAATEFEEIVTSTNVFSRDDYFTVRRFHFVQSLLLDVHAGGRIFYGFRGLTGGQSLYRLLDSISREPGDREDERAFWALLESFNDSAESEFVSPEEFTQQRFRSRDGSHVAKLNPYYLMRLLYEPGTLEAFMNVLRTRLPEIYGSDQKLVEAVVHVTKQRIYPFDGSTSTTIKTHLSLGDLAQAALKPGETPLLPSQLLIEPRHVQMHKHKTHSEFLAPLLETGPKYEAVYDLALHHSRENVGRLLSWSLSQSESTEDRSLANEGGWLY